MSQATVISITKQNYVTPRTGNKCYTSFAIPRHFAMDTSGMD